MKSRMAKESSEKLLKETFQNKMTEIHATGMSYGAKAFAQVVSDMYKTDIETMTSEEQIELLKAIKAFTTTTLENSIENLSKAIQNVKTAYKQLDKAGIIGEINNEIKKNENEKTNNN